VGRRARQTPLLDCSHPDAPEAAEEANERGMAAFKNKQWEQALQDYTQAVLLQPDKVGIPHTSPFGF